MKKDHVKFAVVALLVLIGTFSRLIPHPHNFTAIGAVAIFSMSVLPSRWAAIILPLFAMWISDLFINNFVYPSATFTWFTSGMVWIYLGIIMHSVAAWVLIKKANVVSIAGSSALGAIAFFILSNFGVWSSSTMYEKTWQGLVLCFTAALPFFGNVLAGNLFFGFTLFGIYYLLAKRTSALQAA